MTIERRITVTREELEDLIRKNYSASGEIRFNIVSKPKKQGSTDGVSNYVDVYELDSVLITEVVENKK
jgi:hypothetical protein